MFLILNTDDIPSVPLLNQVERHIKKLYVSNGSEDNVPNNVFFLHCNGICKAEMSSIQISNVMSFITGTYRRLLLHKNEQETILSFSQQLVVIQIVMHQLHMEMISVEEIQNITSKIVTEKLRNVFISQESTNDCCDISYSEDVEEILLREPEKSSKFERIFNGYEKFLADSNMVDFADVLRSMSSELPMNSELQELLSPKKDAVIFINNEAASSAEVKVVSHMIRTCDLFQLTVSTPLDDSLPSDWTIAVEPITEAEAIGKVKVGSGEAGKERSGTSAETYAEQLVLSYLGLLVNSRNELALATIVNVPDRGIGPSSFTEVRRSAASKGLSMYQTIVSFVLKSRLAVGRTSPRGEEDPLAPLAKGLADFVDLYNRMHSVVEEEDTNVRSAVVRLVKMIRNALTKASTVAPSSPAVPKGSPASLFQNPLKRGALESAIARVMESFEIQLKTLESLDERGITPTRLINEGASLNGRKTLRLIRNVLDLHASYDHHSTGVLVADTALTQTGTTPLRMLPSLASKFRSPQEASTQDLGCLFSQNAGTNAPVGLKRNQSTPVRSVQGARKKLKPLFSRSFSSPSENKENIPPEEAAREKPRRQTVDAGKAQTKKKTTSQRRSSKRGLFKKNGSVLEDKAQTTLKQFFR